MIYNTKIVIIENRLGGGLGTMGIATAVFFPSPK
jgi:hypothetical protein